MTTTSELDLSRQWRILRTVLLKEIHHRVKNNLAVISSLLSTQARSTGNADARRVLEESQQRVYSMSLIHEHLYKNERLDRIDFSTYIQQLLRGLNSIFMLEPSRILVEMKVDSVELPVEQAVPCGLILNELLSNALKYAFPDGRNGKIAVLFHESSQGSLELVIEDDGIGLPADVVFKGSTGSLGLQIVEVLVKQLDGTFERQSSNGTRMTVRFPTCRDARSVIPDDQRCA